MEDNLMAMEVRKKYMGTELAPTGDPLIDMWERQIAAGQVPDLDAGEDEKTKERDLATQKAAREHYLRTGEKIYNPMMETPLEYIEKLREKMAPPDFDIDQYRSEIPTSNYSPATLPELPLKAFDDFINIAGLIKK